MIPARGPQTVLYFYHLCVAARLRAHLSTGASREAPVDNASFLLILGMSTPGISGLGTQAYRGGSHRGLSSQAQALTPVIQDQQKTILFGVHAQVSFLCLGTLATA